MLLTLASVSVLAEPSTLKCIIQVSKSGNATVTFVFSSDAEGVFYTYLPRFEKWNITVWSGVLIKKSVFNSSAYFYYNVSFEYSLGYSREFGLNITYRFPYASLYTAERGWFMTPLLSAPPGTRISVTASIEGLGRIIDVSLNGNPVSYALDDGVLRVSIPPLSTVEGLRVTVDYKPAEPPDEIEVERKVNGVLIKVRAADHYKGLAQRIVGLTGEILPRLKETFGFSPDVVEYRFFLPTRMDFSALGYVMGEDINAGGEGPIYLNLALVRFKEGYMETTIIHELIHKALGALGLPANAELRWVHEGVAQYASVKIAELQGVDVSDLKSSLEDSVKAFRTGLLKPGFVGRWSPAGNEAVYYSASYYIISTLAEERGGLSFLKKLADVVRNKGGVKTNQELVEALSSAAGEDLVPIFRDWGFEVSSPKVRIPVMSYRLVVAIAAVVIVATVIFSLAVIMRRSSKARCPYCYAEVIKDMNYCPYCGYLLKPKEVEGQY